jgi:hypothetical protein
MLRVGCCKASNWQLAIGQTVRDQLRSCLAGIERPKTIRRRLTQKNADQKILPEMPKVPKIAGTERGNRRDRTESPKSANR